MDRLFWRAALRVVAIVWPSGESAKPSVTTPGSPGTSRIRESLEAGSLRERQFRPMTPRMSRAASPRHGRGNPAARAPDSRRAKPDGHQARHNPIVVRKSVEARRMVHRRLWRNTVKEPRPVWWQQPRRLPPREAADRLKARLYRIFLRRISAHARMWWHEEFHAETQRAAGTQRRPIQDPGFGTRDEPRLCSARTRSGLFFAPLRPFASLREIRGHSSVLRLRRVRCWR